MKIWIISLFFILTIISFLFFGRSIYKPMINNLKGKRSIALVKSKIEGNALERLSPHIQKIGLDSLPKEILLVGLKTERRLEVYVRENGKEKHLISYPFTAFSGKLGPKLKEGDKQIPEGIYQIEFLNPNSSYHLSMKVNYPNAFDREKAKLEERTDLGGDIFIHGKNVTIGCIPIGDPAIEELFLLAEKALPQGIEVIISPHDFRVDPDMPKLGSVEWEEELYAKIKDEMYSLKWE